MQDVIGNVLEFAYVRHALAVDQLFDAAVHRSLPGADAEVAELNDVLAGLGVLRQIEKHHALARGQIHALNLYWREHALDHEGANLVGIAVCAAAEPIHDQQRRRLQRLREYFGILPRVLLVSHHIFGKAVLLDFHRYRGASGILDEADVVAGFGLRQDHHVGDSKLASHAQEVFQRISFGLPQLQGRKRVHQLSNVHDKFTKVLSNLTSLDYEGFGCLLQFFVLSGVVDVSSRFLASAARFGHVFFVRVKFKYSILM